MFLSYMHISGMSKSYLIPPNPTSLYIIMPKLLRYINSSFLVLVSLVTHWLVSVKVARMLSCFVTSMFFISGLARGVYSLMEKEATRRLAYKCIRISPSLTFSWTVKYIVLLVIIIYSAITKSLIYTFIMIIIIHGKMLHYNCELVFFLFSDTFYVYFKMDNSNKKLILMILSNVVPLPYLWYSFQPFNPNIFYVISLLSYFISRQKVLCFMPITLFYAAFVACQYFYKGPCTIDISFSLWQE